MGKERTSKSCLCVAGNDSLEKKSVKIIERWASG